MSQLSRNAKYITHIWDTFFSIKESLNNKGIELVKGEYDFSFIIRFDFKKINQNSQLYKHNINEILFSSSEVDFTPEITLLRDNKIVYNKEILENLKPFNRLFICKDLLSEILKLIKCDIFIEENNNINDEENNFNNALKKLQEDSTNTFRDSYEILLCHKTLMDSLIAVENEFIENFETLKEKFDDLPSHYDEQISLDINEICSKILIAAKHINTTIRNIDTIKYDEEATFLFDMIKCEKILFSELFRFIPENTTIDKRTKFFKNNFIIMANKIHKYLTTKTNISDSIYDFITKIELK